MRTTRPVPSRHAQATSRTQGGTVEKVTVEMPCKLKALELDAKLAGELQGGVAQDSAAEVPAVAPSDVDARLASILAVMLGMAGCPRSRAALPPREVEVVPVRAPGRLAELSLKVAEGMAKPRGRSHQNVQVVSKQSFFGKTPS